MKKIIGLTICVLVGCYCNGQSAKQNKQKATVSEKAKTQVILPNEKTETVVSEAPGAAPSQLGGAVTVPLSQDKQTQPPSREAQRNNVKASPEKKK